MEMCCLIVLETESSGSRQVWFPLGTARENFLHISLPGSIALDTPWHADGVLHVPLYVRLCLSVAECPLFIRTPVTLDPYKRVWVGKILWRRAWHPTPVFLPRGNPMDRGAWPTTVHGVTQSRTRLRD